MYAQRRPAPESSYVTVGLWAPRIVEENKPPLAVRPRKGDAYVVVDEIVADRVGLVVADWPQQDEAGRLRFPQVGTVPKRSYSLEQLEDLLNRHRKRKQQTLRPLRIGDVFWVRGVSSNPNSWSTVIDVTRATRQASKDALLRAVTYRAASERSFREPQPSPRKRRRRRTSPTPRARVLPPVEPEGSSPGSIAPPGV